MRLAPKALAALPADVRRPAYDRAAQAAGIVHFGIGAFHRAHQAVYTDDAMNAGDRDWGIVGVSLRSPGVAMQLNPQDGLYTVVDRDSAGEEARIVGSVRRVVVAGDDGDRLAATIAAPSTRILSFTITEKGYGRAADGELDVADPGIANDLAGGAPSSVYGYLEAGLRRRRACGGGGLTLLSCDNLSHNGVLLGRLLATFLSERDGDLARWVADLCLTPSTMVDRIVPATTHGDRAALNDRLGVEDAAMVVTEPFRQWVIENRFAGARPAWEAGGAQFVDDVAPFETAKLRLLNGTHSALAYLGLERGHCFVHEAMRDTTLRPVISRVMDEATASLGAAPFDVRTYVNAIVARLENEMLPYRLQQIAADGSQKIAQRWLPMLATTNEACPATMRALAAWIRYARNMPLDQDPMAGRVRKLWQQTDAAHIACALFGRDGLFSPIWTASENELRLLTVEILDCR